MSISEEPESKGGTLSTDRKRVQVERAGSPVPSCLSVKSDPSVEPPLKLRREVTGDQRVQVERAGSPVPSCLSMKSDRSMSHPIFFRGEVTGDQRVQVERAGSPALSCLSMKSDRSMSHPIFFRGEVTGDQRVQVERAGSPVPSDHSMSPQDESIKRAQQELKTHLKKKFEYIFEGLAVQGHTTLLNEIYTELYITEGEVGVNNEHEVRQIETASKRQTTQETPILCNDIFKPLPGQEKRIRTVLTKGIAGIGKTVSVQKFILDWAEGKANQDVDFIFTLPFRDLNLKKEGAFSLMQLLQHYFPQLKEIKSVEGEEVKVVFIFDGLDECRLPLHFQSNEICCDITESSSVDVLLTNLIKGICFPLLSSDHLPTCSSQSDPS
ncbi:hypothetical protein COCON_G00232950 [Conger conger]|uniref:NACHT domain-containing protein n=1 Tax=Conger conger TaxID=82655 RepID=A0A9Q1CVM3_CONCO|nr:hypothetical protein COCON_G00232950 [Conger conger]